jgi:periplasmic protein CpxP/Spy
MKKQIIFILFMLFAGTMAVNAQDAPQRRTAEERTKAAMEKVTPALQLDKVQASRTDSIFLDYYKAMDKLRESMQPGTPPDRSVFEKVGNDRDEKLKQVLSPEQFQKFKNEVEATLRPQRRQQR